MIKFELTFACHEILLRQDDNLGLER